LTRSSASTARFFRTRVRRGKRAEPIHNLRSISGASGRQVPRAPTSVMCEDRDSLRKVSTRPTTYATLMEVAIGAGAGAGQTSSPRIRPRQGASGPGCESLSQAGSVVVPCDPHDSPRTPSLAMWAQAWAGHPNTGDPFQSHPGGFGPCEVSAGVDSKRLAPDPHGQAIDADPRLQSNGAHVILGDPQGCRGGATGRQEPGLGCWLRNGLTQ
jgi:hypothetical protein